MRLIKVNFLKKIIKNSYHYFISKFRNKDVDYFSKFELNEYVFPVNRNEFHLQKCIGHLKTSYLSTGKKGFASKFDYKRNTFGPLYPEVTGYIINTLYEIKGNFNSSKDISWIDNAIENSVKSLMAVQLENGGFTAGHKDMHSYGTPSIFNTGQILLGLSQYLSITGDKFVEESISRAVNFMNLNSGLDGYNPEYCYNKKFSSYYARSAYGHIKAGKLIGDEKSKDKVSNVLKKILSYADQEGSISGWGFKQNWHALHTVIYTLRGFFEVGKELEDAKFLNTSWQGIKWLEDRGPRIKINGKEISNGDLYLKTKEKEICLTGLAQQAVLAQKLINNNFVIDSEFNINNPLVILKSHQFIGSDSAQLEGSLPGSKPIYGKYQPFCSPIWAVKFFADALLQDTYKTVDLQG